MPGAGPDYLTCTLYAHSALENLRLRCSVYQNDTDLAQYYANVRQRIVTWA